MIEFIIWLGALLCTNPNHTISNHGSCNLVHMNIVPGSQTNFGEGGDGGDTGGETTGHPKPPVTPPPPPPGGGS